MLRGILPTLGLIYSFLIPQVPRSTLFHDTFANESTWLDVFYDANPKGPLRSGPVHFVGYLSKEGTHATIEGWQTMLANTPVYLVQSGGTLKTMAASDLPHALVP